MSAPRIRRLPAALVEKIAAGEVVERHASVVKELVENAIDAGATDIVVALERGDDLVISVIDDGTGMEREDALLAFERHATSKIRDAADLEAVATLGFRGEALAAIAAVSEVDLTTSTGREGGVRVSVRGGETPRSAAAARDRGTSIRVRGLFFNTPARRKFLKTQPAEVRAVTREVVAHALASHGVGFTVTLDRETILRLPAALPVAGRLEALYGRELGSGAISVHAEEAGVVVAGFVSGPRETRGVPDAVHLAVNGRPVESRALSRALLSGYGTLLAPRRFPVAAISLRVPFEEVDPNAHPTKKEVRFRSERDLFRILQRAVARGLAGEGIVPEFRPRPAEGSAADFWGLPARPPESPGVGWGSGQPVAEPGPPPWGAPDGAPRIGAGATADAGPAAPGPGALESLLAASAFLQVHKTYLVTEAPDGVLIVDQHTAHERVLYEEGLARLARPAGARQPLLVPATLDLSLEEARLLEEFAEPLAALGFEVRPIGPNAVAVESVPAERRGEDVAGWLREILENLARQGGGRDRFVRAATSYACKTAVRAGDSLRPEEIRSLVARLARTENPYACPHGRPVVVRLTLREIERLFGRR